MSKHVFLAVLAVLSFIDAMAQMPTHPSIESVKASYRPLGVGSTQPVAASPMVRAQVQVLLKNDSLASGIVLRMKDKQTQTLLYEVRYDLVSPDLVTDGIVLFRKQGNNLLITNPFPLALKPFIYELTVENEQAKPGPVWISVQ